MNYADIKLGTWYPEGGFSKVIDGMVELAKEKGVKLNINEGNIKLSVNSTNSGEGNETLKAAYDSNEMTISFNSKYLIDIASVIQDKNLKMRLKDPISPVLIEDNSDKNSFYVIMPMKI